MTKEVVGNFINGRQGDRLGLILFGQNAYLHVPLTLDAASVNSMLRDAVPGMAGSATAIGDAVGLRSAYFARKAGRIPRSSSY